MVEVSLEEPGASSAVEYAKQREIARLEARPSGTTNQRRRGT